MPIFIEEEVRQQFQNGGLAFIPKGIPYEELASKVLASAQTMVPFLGAGASLRPRGNQQSNHLGELESEAVEKVCAQAGITKGSAAWKLLETAVQIAWKMEQHQKGQAAADDNTSKTALSSSQLAELFAKRSAYDCFEKPAKTLKQIVTKADISALIGTLRSAAGFTGIASTAPPLLTAASYYTYMRTAKDPGPLEVLQEVFQNLDEPTLTHRLIARVAQNHLDKTANSGVAQDYLIITTNYDGLMEKALDQLELTTAGGNKIQGLPYVILTVTKKDRIVHARASGSMQQYLGLDDRRFDDFKLKLNPDPRRNVDNFSRPTVMKPLVILYKIHGSLHPGQDSIILSDEDYVTFIQRSSQAEGMIPSPVVNLLDDKGFLMLGYSFSDWNVRALYKRLLEYEAAHRTDWAVLLHYDPFENGFFEYKKINVLNTSLDTFAQRVWDYAVKAGAVQGAL
jgi:hypothetical protein